MTNQSDAAAAIIDDEPEPSEAEQEARLAQMNGFSRGMGTFMGKIGLGPPYIPKREQIMVFWLVGVAMMMNHYDLGIFGLALPRIQETFGTPDAAVGDMMAMLRMGILVSIPLTVMADQIGRTRLFMVTILGAAVCTGLTGFAQTEEQFVALQFLMRCFSYTEDILCFVVIAEVMDSKLRGWAIGALAALGAAGHGLAAIVFALVGQIEGEWRMMYFIGVFPLLIIAWLRRSLTETERFAAHKASKAPSQSLRDRVQPLISLMTAYPGRLLGLCAVLFPFSMGVTSAMTFMPKFLQDEHGYGPEQVSALFLIAGTLSVAGGLLSGRLSDRFGRRSVLLTAVIVNAAGLALFYTVGAGPALVALWLGALFAFFATETMLAALGSELFPTSYRSVASSVRGTVAAIGGVTGLIIQSDLVAMTGSFGMASALPLMLCPIAALIAFFVIPETARRSLEDIAPER